MSGKRGPSASSFGPTSGDGALQVEVIRDEHEVARREVLANAAAGVRDDERAGAEPAEDPHAEHDAVGRVALVEVRAALHHRHRHPGEGAEHERARVPERRRDRPAGDLAVGDLDPVLDPVGEPAQARAEDDCGAWYERRALADRGDGLVDHAEPSATRAS